MTHEHRLLIFPALLALIMMLTAFFVRPAYASNATYSTLDGNGWVKVDDNTWTKSDSQGNVIVTLKTQGNVWKYYFHVDDPDAVFYAWEDSVPDGYQIVDSKGARTSPISINHKDGTDGVITNSTQSKYHYGSILLTKKVMGAADKTKVFHFTVTVTADDANGTKLINDAKSFGDVPFTNGVGKVDLKAGETVYMSGIPQGAAWKIEETPDSDYRTSFSTNTGVTTNGGSIQGIVASDSDQTVSVVCTNENIHVEPQYGHLAVSKTVKNGDPSDKFGFLATFWNLKAGEKYTASLTAKDSTKTQQSFTANPAKMGSLSFTLSDGGHIDFAGLPEGTQYQIKESKSDGYAASFKITGSGVTSVTPEKSNVGSGDLTTAKETLDLRSDGTAENATINFTNEKVGGFSVKKVAVDGIDTDTFHFTAALWGLKPSVEYTAVLTEKDGTTSDLSFKSGGSGMGTISFDLTNGAELSIDSLPAGAQYQISESATEGYTSSYKISGEGVKAAKTENANTYQNTGLTTAKETVDAVTVGGKKTAEHALVVFTNQGSKDNASGGFTVVKKISGTSVNDKFGFTASLYGLKAGTKYTAAITDKDGLTETKEYTAAGDGTGELPFTLGDGDKAYFGGLPVGSKYSVEEEASAYYTASYKISGTGIIAAKQEAANTAPDKALSTDVETLDRLQDGKTEDATITFTNTDSDKTKKGSLTVTKKNDGGTLSDAFAFEARFTGLRGNYTYTANITKKDGTASSPSFKSTLGGEGYLSFGLSDGDRIVFNNLPVGTSWKVTESGSEGYLASYAVTGMKTVVSASGTAKVSGEDLSTAEEKIGDAGTLGDNAQVTFTNTKKGAFDVIKTVKGKEGDTDSFHFTVKQSGLKPNEKYIAEKKTLNGSENIEYTAGKDGTSEVHFDLKDKEKVSFKDLPIGSRYSVKETGTVYYESSYDISGTGVKAEEYTRTSDSENEDLETKTETLDKDEFAAVTFTNSYHDHKNEKVYVTATKDWEDDDNLDGERPDEVTVHLMRTWEGNTAKPEEVDSAVLNSSNSWTHRFDQLPKYRSDADTVPYIYEVVEDKVNHYDTEVVYKEIDGGSREALVINTIHRPKGDLSITKHVQGDGADKNTAFQFVITLKKDGKPVSGEFRFDTEKGNVEGRTRFNENGVAMVDVKDGQTLVISDLPGGAEYSIEETEAACWTPSLQDGTSWTGKIEDGKVSKLSVMNTYDGFVNLTVNKIVTGNMGNKQKQFHFELTLSNHADHPNVKIPASLEAEKNRKAMTVTGNNGVFSFTLSNKDSIVFKRIPVYLCYSIKELDGSQKGYKVSVREQSWHMPLWGKMKDNDAPRLLDEDKLVEYTNNYESWIPTNAALGIVLPAALVIAGAAGIVIVLIVLSKKKKKH